MTEVAAPENQQRRGGTVVNRIESAGRAVFATAREVLEVAKGAIENPRSVFETISRAWRVSKKEPEPQKAKVARPEIRKPIPIPETPVAEPKPPSVNPPEEKKVVAENLSQEPVRSTTISPDLEVKSDGHFFEVTQQATGEFKIHVDADLDQAIRDKNVLFVYQRGIGFSNGNNPSTRFLETSDFGGERPMFGSCVVLVARSPETKKTCMVHADTLTDLQAARDQMHQYFGEEAVDLAVIGGQSGRSEGTLNNVNSIFSQEERWTLKQIDILGENRMRQVVVDAQTGSIYDLQGDDRRNMKPWNYDLPPEIKLRAARANMVNEALYVDVNLQEKPKTEEEKAVDLVRGEVDRALKEEFGKSSLFYPEFSRRFAGKLRTTLSVTGLESNDFLGTCGSLSEELERAMRQLDKECEVNTANSTDSDTNGHRYLIREFDDREVIIDPSIGQFLDGYTWVFVGTRNRLHELVLSGRYPLINTSSRDNPQRAFERIWGESSRKYKYYTSLVNLQ